jgi:UDP-N-acetylglucosamine:LPS N-acetylglucosamine transferase
MPSVDLVYFNAGGGHRASALALQRSIAEAGLGWDVRLVNLTELLDPAGKLRRFAFSPEDYYNARLAYGLTLGLRTELRLLQALIGVLNPTLVRVLQQHWLRSEPDLVVSLIPNFNRPLYESLATTLPGVPYVTVLTDLADHPPHFWMEPGQDQHLVCGTPHAVQQALAAGFDAARVHATSGMIIRPDFYRLPADFDRAAARAAQGLDPLRPTGVVMFGGHGSRSMLGIAERLADQQLILMCGHNAKLAARLRELPAAAPRLVLGFTHEVAQVMRMADYFIGKPGPGSLSEAMHLGLPVVVTRNAWTMPQERYNTQWVRDLGLGLVLPSFRQIAPAVQRLGAELPAYQSRVAALANRAVFEVPRILQRILQDANAAPQPLPRAALT